MKCGVGLKSFFGFVIFSLGFVAEYFCAGFSQERSVRRARARACTQRREQGGGEERKRRGI